MHSLGICNTLTGSATITKLQTILVEFLKTPKKALYDLRVVMGGFVKPKTANRIEKYRTVTEKN